MKSTFQKLTAGVVIAGIFTASLFAASPAGYVDFGSFEASPDKEYVEVDINKALLKLAATFAKNEDPEIAEILGNLEHVHVNVVGMDDSNRESATDRIETLRARLETEGWARIITVREAKGDNVAVFLKQANDESIQGVVVTVIGGDGEAVLVNVVGDVQLDQIARLGERLNIDPLAKLNMKPAAVES